MQLTPAVRDQILLKKEAPAVYLGPADSLAIVSWNSLSTVTQLTLSGRFLNLEGEMIDFSERHVPNTDRSLAASNFRLGEGWLLSLQLVSNSTPIVGQTFVRVATTRGAGQAGTALMTLMQGYCGALQALSWPLSPIVNTISGRGVIRSITGTDPAAGAEILEVVPTGARWRPIALAVSLVTDATVTNRSPELFFSDGTLAFYSCDPPAVQTASLNRFYNGSCGGERLAAIAENPQWNIPNELILLAGFKIRTNTLNLQAGDNWAAPQMLVEEWLEAK